MPDLRIAPDEVRLLIIECLRDEQRRFLDTRSSSKAWLDEWGIRHPFLFDELALDLETYHLFLKPREAGKIQRYQYVMRWDNNGLLIHFTLSPKGDPPVLLVSLHPHNSGYPPLPLKPIKK